MIGPLFRPKRALARESRPDKPKLLWSFGRAVRRSARAEAKGGAAWTVGLQSGRGRPDARICVHPREAAAAGLTKPAHRPALPADHAAQPRAGARDHGDLLSVHGDGALDPAPGDRRAAGAAQHDDRQPRAVSDLLRDGAGLHPGLARRHRADDRRRDEARGRLRAGDGAVPGVHGGPRRSRHRRDAGRGRRRGRRRRARTARRRWRSWCRRSSSARSSAASRSAS